VIPILTALAPFLISGAPHLAKWIGNVIAGKAGQEVAAELEPAVTAAAIRATGADSAEAATQVILRDPNSDAAKEMLREFQQIASQVQIAQLQADVERQKIEAEAHSNARSLLRDLAQLGSINAFFMPALTTLYTIGFFVFSWWLLNTQMGFDERRTVILQIIVGALIVILKDLIGFWTGTTSSSRMKDAQIAAIPASPALPPPPPLALPAPPVNVTVQPSPAALPNPQYVPPADASAKPSRFGGVIGRLLASEGGYVNNPRDNGGCTNMGITIGRLREWRNNPNLTCEDVRAMPREEAEQIYRIGYWNAVQCDQLPCGVDYEVFDCAVNQGLRRAAEFLQSILTKYDATISVDGIIGPLTLAAAKKVPPIQIVDMLYEARMQHYRSLNDWDEFGSGWTKRADRVRDEARADIASLKA